MKWHSMNWEVIDKPQPKPKHKPKAKAQAEVVYIIAMCHVHHSTFNKLSSAQTNLRGGVGFGFTQSVPELLIGLPL